MVEDSSWEYLEPALELRMKICRISAIKRKREVIQRLLNQGGTAGIPVPYGIGVSAFLVYASSDRNGMQIPR